MHEKLKTELYTATFQTMTENHDLSTLERTEFLRELDAVTEICKFGQPRMHKYLVDLKYFLLGFSEMHDYAKDKWFKRELGTVIKICELGWPRVRKYLRSLKRSLNPPDKKNIKTASSNVVSLSEGKRHG